MSIRLLLADDHSLVRSGLRFLLDSEPDFEVIGEAADGHEVLCRVRETLPQVVLMDLSMHGMNGFEASRRIAAEHPAVKILCVSMYSEGPLVAAALRGGASGYVVKSCPVDELLRAVRAVAAGLKYISPAVASSAIDELGRPRGAAPPSAFEILTPREREVLQLLAEGLRSKQIAARLRISVKTVGTYRERLLQKIGVDGVASLTRYAIAQGVTPSPGLLHPAR
ncbi:MAG TPA: response regulator transcription factor [Thermoanaerobaculia bacterium]|nr:response regulator transcription factor [Thermoanaerobaculia bacterium]